jgi:hypothetical protein
LRGINAMEHCSHLVIAGRIEPTALCMEAEARILWPSEELTLPGCYQWQQGDHGGVVGHVDPHVDAVLRSYREAEMEQAIGRLRAVRSATTKTVYVITNAPCPLPVDESVALDTLLPGYRLARLLLMGDGVAVLNPKSMAANLPDVFPTETAAKRWASKERALKGTSPLLEEFYYKGMGTLFRFRVEGQRGSDNRALTWHTDQPTAHAALAGQFTKPVTVTEWPPNPPSNVPAKPTEEPEEPPFAPKN